MSDAHPAPRRRPHRHRPVQDPARHLARRAGRRRPRAARAQRRRQDDDAAHDHGPVARAQGRDRLSPPRHHRHAHARHRPARHRLRAGEHGHLRRADGRGEHAPCRHARPLRQGAARSGLRAFPGDGEVLGQARPTRCPAGRSRCWRSRAPSSSARELILIDEPTKGLAPGDHPQHDRGVPRDRRARRPSCWSSRISISPARWGGRVAVIDDGRIIHRGEMADACRRRRTADPAAQPVAERALIEATTMNRSPKPSKASAASTCFPSLLAVRRLRRDRRARRHG